MASRFTSTLKVALSFPLTARFVIRNALCFDQIPELIARLFESLLINDWRVGARRFR